MSSYLRDKFGLPQERLASWLGIKRGAVVMAEGRQRFLPGGAAVQEARLVLASLGKVFAPGAPDNALPAAPAHPRARAGRSGLARPGVPGAGRAHPAPAGGPAPASRAARSPAGGPARPARPARLCRPGAQPHPRSRLALLQGEAADGLRTQCGRGAQRLLEARLAGLEHEAELLEALVAGRATPGPPGGQTPPGAVL